jgi:hypothetical protein
LENGSGDRLTVARVPFGLWLAFVHPVGFFVLLLVLLAGFALLVRLLWRGLRRLASSKATA